MLNVLCLVTVKSFLFDLVSKNWFVCFIEVKFHRGVQLSVRFTQVSALECPHFRGDFMSIWQENGRAKSFVHFSQDAALEHVRFRQVLLYKIWYINEATRNFVLIQYTDIQIGHNDW